MKIHDFYIERYSGKNFSIKKKRPDSIIMLKKVISTLNLEGKTVLDVGSGDGYILETIRKISNKNSDLYGIDLSKDNLDNLKTKKIKGFSVDVSSEKLPFKSNYFDIIIMSEVIEHIFDCKSSLKEIYRVLKKGGVFLIMTHNSFNILMRVKYLLGIVPTPSFDVTGPTMGEHIRMFNYKILLKLLECSGFKRRNIRNYSWFKYKYICFYTRFLTKLFSRHFLLLCRK